jgi:hypothetical protein
VVLNNALVDERNGTALDIARRLRQTVMQRMSQSSIQQLIADPPNIGGGFDLMSLGDLSSLPQELAGQMQGMLDQVNADARGFLENMNGAFANTPMFNPNAPDMGYFSDATGPRGLRLTTGERATLQKAAMDMASQSVQYRQQGDKLMEEALEKTPLQQVLEMKRARSYMQESYRFLDLSL